MIEFTDIDGLISFGGIVSYWYAYKRLQAKLHKQMIKAQASEGGITAIQLGWVAISISHPDRTLINEGDSNSRDFRSMFP